MPAEMKLRFMREAILIAREKMQAGQGGPFGAVIVREGKVISRGWNQVTSANDPTAHAEIVAIRQACLELKTFALKGCEIYCSCEPCPMCLSAIYWARLGRIYFAGTETDAAEAGFDDAFLYREMFEPLDRRKIASEQLLRHEVLPVFQDWKAKADKIRY
ncbi:MAG TPA: nucleoside deaminase [Verrucomicrobiae bacterium]|jgi:tRNA(Arg) A34 adenosine deaminase TadA